MTSPKLRRQIFYFHGFDRRGPRFFNLWQKREARAYVARHGGELIVGDIEGTSWQISGPFVETQFHFMDWTSVIRPRFRQSFWRGLSDMIGLGLAALRQGMFGKIRRADWAIGVLMIWAFLPVFLGGLAVGIAAFWGVFGAIIALVLGLCAGWMIHRFDRYFGIFYALNIAWAARRMAMRDAPALEARVATFEAMLRDVEADEIILVGHSVGSALAVRLLEVAPVGAKLLTVGQSIPLVSFQREAGWLRQALSRLKASGATWVDVSAGRDPLGFSAFDPSDGGAACVSAHLGASFEPKVLKALKFRGFDMHFLYFRAVERLGSSWDWFGVLAGKTPLEMRFEPEKRLMSGRRARF